MGEGDKAQTSNYKIITGMKVIGSTVNNVSVDIATTLNGNHLVMYIIVESLLYTQNQCNIVHQPYFTLKIVSQLQIRVTLTKYFLATPRF